MSTRNNFRFIKISFLNIFALWWCSGHAEIVAAVQTETVLRKAASQQMASRKVCLA